ncbi:beta strand repeat-containing protein [Moorena producens]|uniref:beta strand repeat-containing protein n=1 Tax=Moorena producens TaxID=1155739 RepID=UPI003C71B9CB
MSRWPDPELTVSDRVGIGTDTPSQELEVIGDISATNLTLSGSATAAQFVGDGSSLTGLVTTTGNSTINGSLTIDENLTVGGNFQLGTLSINTFSSDGNLADNSNLAVPTEQAVKTYVDNQISTRAALNGAANQDFATNNLSVSGNLQVSGNLEVQGDVIARDTEHIAGNVSLGDEDSDVITITGVVSSGHSSGALEVNSALHTTESLTVDGSLSVGNAIATAQLSVTEQVTGSLTIENSLQLGTGLAINAFSSDGNLGNNSNLAVPTEQAVKTYVDNQITQVNNALDTKAALNGAADQDFTANNLTVDGSLSVSNAIATAQLSVTDRVTGSLAIENNLTVNGNLTTTGSLDLGGDLRLRGADIRDAGNTSRIRLIDNGDLSLRASNGIHSLTIAENRNVGIITTDPQARLHIIGGTDAEPNGGGYLVVGNTNRVNLAIDDNEIMARNNGAVSNLHLQASGGNLLIQNKSPGRVGIGLSNPVTTLHVRGTKNGAASMANHIAVIENTSTGTSADVLALKIGTISPGSACNFITFKSGDRDVGSIEGTGNNNIRLRSGSGDYAEYLPRLNHSEVIEPGELVGVFGGKVTKYTQGADQVMAITNQPIVLGNAPQKQEQHLYEQVAFLGQVPIKVRGSVQSGDYIIPSGFNDGMGIAVSPHEIAANQFALIVGRAWETSEQEGVKPINVVVGLNSNSHWLSSLLQKMQIQQSEIKILKNQIQELKSPTGVSVS